MRLLSIVLLVASLLVVSPARCFADDDLSAFLGGDPLVAELAAPSCDLTCEVDTNNPGACGCQSEKPCNCSGNGSTRQCTCEDSTGKKTTCKRQSNGQGCSCS